MLILGLYKVLLFISLISSSEKGVFFVNSFGHSTTTTTVTTTTFFHKKSTQKPSSSRVILFGGYGKSDKYTWKENQFEIDLTVKVPAGTTSKQIIFKSSPQSIDLRLSTGGNTEPVLLLDGERKMRGKLNMDGTFWSIADSEEEAGENDGREVTVTIEKNKLSSSTVYVEDQEDMFSPTSDQDEDWGGIYPDDEEEVYEREYKEAEELDLRDYAKSLGVDLDNLNMSMVDKSMFSLVNMTSDTFEQLEEKGYVEQVTEQKEGGGGEDSPSVADNNDDSFLSPLGKMMMESSTLTKQNNKIPIIDDEEEKDAQNSTEEENEMTESKQKLNEKQQQLQEDPIDMLTVARLKEILREQKLKVSGSKQELRDRLRDHIQNLTQQKQEE